VHNSIAVWATVMLMVEQLSLLERSGADVMHQRSLPGAPLWAGGAPGKFPFKKFSSSPCFNPC
jgi:hypothetical protein